MRDRRVQFELKDAYNAGLATGARATVLDILIGGILYIIFADAKDSWGLGKDFLYGFGIGWLISLALVLPPVIREIKRDYYYKSSRSPAAIPGAVVGVASAVATTIAMVAMGIISVIGLFAAPTIIIIIVID